MSQVSRLVDAFNTESQEAMALTSQPEREKSDKKDKKKRKTSDRRASEKLLPNNHRHQPLRGGTDQNHIDDGYLKHRRDHRIRSVTSEQERDSCFLCLRNALHCYNVVVLIMGCGLLGVGIWLLVTDFSAREITVLISSSEFEIGTYMILAGGGLVALLAFCGCCGTMREDRCILGFYGIVLALVFLALVAAGAMAALFRDQITEDIKVKLERTLQNQYGMDVRGNTTNRLVTDAWDSMQRKLECCGPYSLDEDGEDLKGAKSWDFYKSTKWYITKLQKYPMVPESCCIEGADKQKCQGQTIIIKGPPNYGPASLPKKFESHLYTEGCFEKVIKYLGESTLILGGVALGVPLFLVVGSIIAFCLCARVKKSDTSFDEEEDL
ncbi:tetraspanin-18B-like isoform X3 [Saccostrea echinata]|uniref:tetraspanin-18B-like isoform X3 n=1 Tax=Saccostrea echinata TaxID=191078 RepID=UPI002A7F8C14|nr:tetraspanin-18B-like isoform X3 [Saccostrea echinata]